MLKLAGWIVIVGRRRPRFPNRFHRRCNHRIGEGFFTRAIRRHLIAHNRLLMLLLMMMMIFVILGKIRLDFELVIVEILLAEAIVVLISWCVGC